MKGCTLKKFNLIKFKMAHFLPLFTVKFLIVAAALIRIRKIIFQCTVPKVQLRLLLEVLPEKFNHPPRGYQSQLPVAMTQPFMSNAHIKIYMPYESI